MIYFLLLVLFSCPIYLTIFEEINNVIKAKQMSCFPGDKYIATVTFLQSDASAHVIQICNNSFESFKTTLLEIKRSECENIEWLCMVSFLISSFHVLLTLFLSLVLM